MKKQATKKTWKNDRQKRAAAKAAKLNKAVQKAAAQLKVAVAKRSKAPMAVVRPVKVLAVGGIPKPVIDQTWRAKIDWVAAGKKAHASKLANLAAKAAVTP